jgi:hypothetical protein
MKSMADFAWVKARADCTVGLMFERLKVGVEADATVRNKMAEGKEGRAFRFFVEGEVFGVLLDDGTTTHRVKFAVVGSAITVTQDDQPTISGSVTLCDDGQCRLKLGERELELWQFRCRALEHLFFNLIVDAR